MKDIDWTEDWEEDDGKKMVLCIGNHIDFIQGKLYDYSQGDKSWFITIYHSNKVKWSKMTESIFHRDFKFV